MNRKVSVVILMGLLATLLSACGGGTAPSNSDAVAQNIKEALVAVSGVADATARYNVNPGMGSTVHVNVTAEAGTPSLEKVMADSLKAFASSAKDVKPSSGMSFQVTEEGESNTITPAAVGLPQSPTVADIRTYAADTK